MSEVRKIHSILKEFLEEVLHLIDVGASFFFLKLDDMLELIFRLMKFVQIFSSGSFINIAFESVVTFKDPQLLYTLLLLLKLLFFVNEGLFLGTTSKFYPYFRAFLQLYTYLLFESIIWGPFISFLIFYVLLMLLKIHGFYWLLKFIGLFFLTLKSIFSTLFIILTGLLVVSNLLLILLNIFVSAKSINFSFFFLKFFGF